jgi:hypothetical protein
MMWTARLMGILLASLAATGCASVLKVQATSETTASQEGSKAGVPFYRKKTVWRQETTYESRAAKVALRIGKRESGKLVAEYVDSAIVPVRDAAIEALRAAIEAEHGRRVQTRSDSDASRARVVAAFGTLKRASIDPASPSSPKLVGNSVKQVSLVDTTVVYFLNGSLPWFGSATATAELSGDGTLSKASGQAESVLGEALSAILPVKEFASAELIAPAPAVAVESMKKVEKPLLPLPEPAEEWAFEVEIEEIGYRFVFENDYAAEPKPLTPIGFDPTGGRFVRTPLEAPPAKKSEGKTVSFRGDVELPKE